MNRLDRLTSILIQLQSKRIVKSQEIADRFGISLRTVYRDIRTLELAGLPLISEAGVGYSLVEGYRLPPVHFTREEAMSFVTAGKLVQKLTDSTTRQSYQSALFKIKAVLRTNEKELLDDITNYIEVLDNKYLPKDRHKNLYIEQILNCILNRYLVRIAYYSTKTLQSSSRDLEPIGIYSNGPYWYLIAFCRLRASYRNFRLDRVQSIQVLEERFSTRHPSLQNFIEETSQQKSVQKVVIRLEKTSYQYLCDQQYYHGFISQTEIGDQIEMTFLTASLPGFAHWYLLLGEVAEIVEPEELNALVLEKLEKIRLRISQSLLT
ncbi:YafY family protein [Telluribacter sp.]|jgi:predicted DNA-binding transcriptional regulator YafY|uniref:helix-turn-helix transcriptional regulator n=1 Tax=Telluribacter sp. TaxID=1978767 RepID=UPI002E1188B6|nr:YafY family protein [Telluribacter sp.]